MKIDLAPGSPEPRRAMALAQAAESLGFDGIWLAETDRDPFVALALIAAATKRLELGTAVAIAFARSPVSMAMTAWGLAELSGGRFRLGLGTQVRAHIVRRFGMDWSAPAPRLAEWIGAMRAAWQAWQTGSDFRYSSEHFELSLMPDFFRPPPLPSGALAQSGGNGACAIPVSIAGVGQPLARLAGRIAPPLPRGDDRAGAPGGRRFPHDAGPLRTDRAGIPGARRGRGHARGGPAPGRVLRRDADLPEGAGAARPCSRR